MDGKKTYWIAAILGILVVVDGLTAMFSEGGTASWSSIRTHLVILAVAGLGVSLRHALKKLESTS